MAVYLNDARLALANQLGEDTISNPWPASRDQAIQWSLERIARFYDFDFGMEVLSVTLDSTGKYTFSPTDNVRADPEMDVRIVLSGPYNDHVFVVVDRDNFDDYGLNSYRYYVDTDAAGNQTIVTTEPSATIQITATRVAPVLSATVPSNFPSALAIAKGALIYVREYEDKDADTSVEDAKFQQIMAEVIGAEQRSTPPGRAMTLQELRGGSTGDVRGDRYGYWI